MAPEFKSLEVLGWRPALEAAFAEFLERGFVPGRVAAEERHRYAVLTAEGEVPASVAGKLMHRAESAAELPKVGDWVALSVLANEGKGVIHQVLPRRTVLKRKVPGRRVEEQVLAANIDVVFLVQALDPSFNVRRLERLLVMACERRRAARGGAQQGGLVRRPTSSLSRRARRGQ
jgi:ribosome biogenesis GTPase